MRTLQLSHKTSPTIIKSKMKAAKSMGDYKRWQIIYQVCCYEVDADYLYVLPF